MMADNWQSVHSPLPVFDHQQREEVLVLEKCSRLDIIVRATEDNELAM